MSYRAVINIFAAISVALMVAGPVAAMLIERLATVQATLLVVGVK